MSDALREEIKAIREEMGEDWKAYKKANDERLKALEDGDATSDYQEKLAKMDDNLDKLEDRLGELEAELDVRSKAEEAANDDKTPTKYRKAICEFVKARGDVQGMKAESRESLEEFAGWMDQEKGIRTKSLVEDATGEILITPEVEQRIYGEPPPQVIIRNRVPSIPTQKNRVSRRTMTGGLVFWGKLDQGLLAGAGGQTLQDTESTPVPSEDTVYVENLYGLMLISEDELEDVDISLEAWIVANFRNKMLEAEDAAAFAGRGHNFQEWEGLLLGTTVQRFAGSTPGALPVEDYMDAQDEINDVYMDGAVWVVNPSTRGGIRKLKGTDGHYLWEPALTEGAPIQFLGHPLFAKAQIPAIPDAGTAGDAAILVNPAQAQQIRDRRGMTLRRIEEKWIENDLVGFRVKKRSAHAVVRPAAAVIIEVPAA